MTLKRELSHSTLDFVRTKKEVYRKFSMLNLKVSGAERTKMIQKSRFDVMTSIHIKLPITVSIRDFKTLLI